VCGPNDLLAHGCSSGTHWPKARPGRSPSVRGWTSNFVGMRGQSEPAHDVTRIGFDHGGVAAMGWAVIVRRQFGGAERVWHREI